MPEWSTCSIPLSSSESDPLTLAEALALADAELADEWANLSLGYPSHSEGAPRLRAAIASLYAGVDAADVLVCAPCEGIFLAMSALLEPGDGVIATTPCYASLAEVAASLGASVAPWAPRVVETGGGARSFEFAVADLAAQLAARPARLVIVNSPHNPTGATLDHVAMAEVAKLCEAHGARLFCDEMYRGLERASDAAGGEWPGAAAAPAACEASERAVTLGGVSKVFGMPGVRIGWLATRDSRMLARAAELKDWTTLCSAAPSELLATVALRARSRVLARSRARAAAGLARVRAFVEDVSGFELLEPRGGTVALVRLGSYSNGAAGEAAARAYCAYLAREADAMLVPAGVFPAYGNGLPAADAACVRVGYAGDVGRLESGLGVWRAHHADAAVAAARAVGE